MRKQYFEDKPVPKLVKFKNCEIISIESGGFTPAHSCKINCQEENDTEEKTDQHEKPSEIFTCEAKEKK